jgi:hypothetical protein
MSRLNIGTFEGVQVFEGKCEGCGQTARMVWDESVQRYLCASCLKAK